MHKEMHKWTNEWIFIYVFNYLIMYLCMFLWLSGRALRQQCKGCGFDSQETHILIKMYNLNAL